VPTSGQVGNDPATAPRYYYVYNGHGDVVALTDASGTPVASYGYDAWGVVTVDTEHFASGWHNPYLYDGRDGARYDAETGLYWLSVRAYDPTLGRFLSHDPLGRAPLFFADQPYVYAGNNPLLNVDPTGQRMAVGGDAGVTARGGASDATRVTATSGVGPTSKSSMCPVRLGGTCYTLDYAWGHRAHFEFDFFTAYGSGWLGIWGQAEVDFTTYLYLSGRIAGSQFWAGVDAGLIKDMWTAAKLHQHHQEHGWLSEGIALWIDFIYSPGVATFWDAHNYSIFDYSFSSAGLSWFHHEPRNERRFINDTLVVLLDVQLVEEGFAGSSAAVLSVLCWPNTGCLKTMVDRFYPREYPVAGSWFNGFGGWVLTWAACLTPVFNGVC
jgi:RHS repeat-associated protein